LEEVRLVCFSTEPAPTSIIDRRGTRLGRRHGCILLLLLVPWTSRLAGDTSDARFVAGLNERQLFDLAERHCREQLGRSGLTDDRRAELTGLLVRTLSLHALNSPKDQRAALWQQAEEAFQAFATALPQSTRLPQVELESLWSRLRQGELLRLEAEVDPDRARALAQARDLLREAIRGLESLRDRIRPGGDVSGEVQQTLRAQVDFALASAYRQQALSYPKGSPDHVLLLTRALKLFNSIARMPNDSTIAIESLFAEVDCLRRMGNLADAARRLQDLQSRELAAEKRFQIVVEQARLLIEAQQIESAVQRLEAEPRPATADESLLAEADLTLMEAYIDLWRSAIRQSNTTAAQQWQSRAGQLLQAMEQTRSVYWVRRAGQLLASTSGSTAEVGDLHVLERMAEQFFAQQDFAQAAATYSRAAELARQIGDQETAFQLGMRSAAVLRQNGQMSEAIQAFRNLALANPSADTATLAHLWAIQTAADVARGPAHELATYTELLLEHLSRWPQADSANQVRLWLARLCLAEGRRQEALQHLLRIDSTFERFDQVIPLAVAACWHELRQTEMSTPERLALSRRVADYFEESFLALSSSDTWSASQRSAAIAAAQLRLLADAPPVATLSRVVEYVTAAIPSSTENSAEQHNLQALLGLCLVYRQQWAEARQHLGHVDWAQVELPLEILAHLGHDSAPKDEFVAQHQAEIAAGVSEKLEDCSASWTVEQQQILARHRAESLFHSGDRDTALVVYHQLAIGRPKDPLVLEGYARCVQQGDEPADLKQALALWRQVVRWTPVATERWFRAKLAIARLHIRLGDAARAEEVIRLTQALHPELGGEELARQFLQTLQECKSVQSAR
jgi:tetratricopeptide (TPR) repeat protein